MSLACGKSNGTTNVILIELHMCPPPRTAWLKSQSKGVLMSSSPVFTQFAPGLEIQAPGYALPLICGFWNISAPLGTFPEEQMRGFNSARRPVDRALTLEPQAIARPAQGPSRGPAEHTSPTDRGSKLSRHAPGAAAAGRLSTDLMAPRQELSLISRSRGP